MQLLKGKQRLWQHLKQDWCWESFEDLKQLQTNVERLLGTLTKEVVASLTGYALILQARSVANISCIGINQRQNCLNSLLYKLTSKLQN